MAEGEVFFSEGILAGSLVATADGWCPVESLEPGDDVLTFDAGPRLLQAVYRAHASVAPKDWPAVHWPLLVPEGALGNLNALRVLPGQLILLESDLAERMFGDPFALVPARALELWRGVLPCPPRPNEQAFVLGFADEQLVYVNRGTLLHCAGLEPDTLVHSVTQSAAYAPLSLASARELIAAMMAEDIGAALSGAAPKGNQAALG